MFHRPKLVIQTLASWATLCLAVATAQAPPPEPRMDVRSAGCPAPEDAMSQFKDLSDIRAGLQLEGKELPPDCSTEVFQGKQRAATMTDSIMAVQWAPANFFHQPLYFEDTPLERYGQSVAPHFQPILSGGRFFLTLPIMPYKLGADHPYDCVTTLGYYRPGICAPCVMQVPPPLEWDAALLQAGTTVALVLLLP